MVEFANQTVVSPSTRPRLVGAHTGEIITGDATRQELHGRGNDTLDAGGGDDIVDGGEGADQLRGGAGNDVLFIDSDDTLVDGGADYDQVYADVREAEAGLTFYLANTRVEYVAGSMNRDVISASGVTEGVWLDGTSGDDVLIGGSNADSLLGGSGNDTLLGGSGEDWFFASLGRDIMTGGFGNDTFAFAGVTEFAVGRTICDVINDFVSGQDVIDLHLIDASTTQAGNQDFSFIGTAAFTAEGQVRALQGVGGVIGVEVNISGTTGADMLILVKGPSSLSAANFIL